MSRLLISAAFAVLVPVAASACASGAKCVSVGDAEIVAASATTELETGARWLKAPEPIAPTVPLAAAAPTSPMIVSPIYEPGDVLPKGQYSMLMNSAYHGLPPAPEGTLYFQVDMKVLLVDRSSYEVIQDVSRDVAATF